MILRRPVLRGGGPGRAILRKRAEELAHGIDTRPPEPALEMLVFQLAWESYAVEMATVREVSPLRELTPIPCTPPFHLGVVNLRGELCPVIDLKQLLGLPPRGLSNATSVVVLQGAQMEIGLVADVIVGVRALPVGAIGPVPSTFSGRQAEFLRGVASGPVAVLDATRILAHPDLVVDEQVGG